MRLVFLLIFHFKNITNIPHQKTTDIAINLTKKELKKLFFFATSQTHFIFNSKFYNQIDGVAMGSPLAPVLANTFMGFYECKWLHGYNVDDSLAAFDNEQGSLNFFHF